MMEYLSIDFETRSTVDLRKTGVYPYAAHEDTSIICMAWAIGDGAVLVWEPGDPEQGTTYFPEEIVEWIRAGKPLRAHNAQFERVMWRDCLTRMVPDVPVPDLEQWHCTAAEAAAMSLPRSLGKVSKVLNVDQQKSDAGHRLMMQMCKPRSVDEDGTIHWWDEEDAEKLADLIDYCKQDVRAERAVAQKLKRLGEQERRVYLLDQKINDRGVRLDVPLIQAAKDIADKEMERAHDRMKEVTNGEVTKTTQVQRLTEWLHDQGLEIPNLRKATIRDFLEEADFPNQETQRALEIRQSAAKTSTRKLKAMLRCRCEDDYARGLLLYHGANTGRWSGKLIQPQNFPRPSVKCADWCASQHDKDAPCDCDGVRRFIPAVRDKANLVWEEQGEQSLEVISSLLRSMLIASPGHRLIAGDFSQIEARVTGWIAGEPYGDLEYEKMASSIFGVPVSEVTEQQRQVGKVAILGCGFQMGSDRYQDTVKQWTGMEISDDVAEKAVQTYRNQKYGVKQFWYAIEDAAREAVLNPGKVTYCGVGAPIKYTYRGQFLWTILPSGRPLAYALPQVRVVTTPWGDQKEAVTYMGIDSYTRKWKRQKTYGGHLTENVVQAMARDIMAEAMLRLEEAGYPIALTVHDEVVADVPEEHGSLEEFLEIMQQTPEWASGCSIEVEGWAGNRYRK